MTSWAEELQVWKKSENHFTIISVIYVNSKSQTFQPLFSKRRLRKKEIHAAHLLTDGPRRSSKIQG